MREQLAEAWEKLIAKLNSWIETIVTMMPNILIAAVVLVISIFLARLVHKYVQKFTKRFTHNEAVSTVASSVATAIFMLLSLFLVLSVLNLSTALTSLLAGAGVVGLAVGLALQDPIINLFSGVMMSIKSMFNIGDLVETNGFFGTIEKITLRSTVLRAPTGELVTIPNKDVFQSPLKNYTVSGKRRIIVECGVSYGDDLDKVQKIAVDAISNIATEDQIEFYFTTFGDSSINFMLRFWQQETKQVPILSAKSRAIIAIKKAFDENDIMIPFPIRTLDFGIRGGEKLNEVMDFNKKDSAVEKNGE